MPNTTTTTTTTTTTITLEALERLATELETEDSAQRGRLQRLCRAYVRILAQRDPDHFERQPCHRGDEAGHYDTSYPPDQVYSDHSGPRVIQICERVTEDIATSGGYYYDWRRVTTYGGLYVGRDGTWYRSDESGTGRVGQFAAHPGDCSVDCTIEWSHTADLTTAELTTAELTLRELAFPLVAERLARIQSAL